MEIILELINEETVSGICGKKMMRAFFLLMITVCLFTYTYREIPVYSDDVHEESGSETLIHPAAGMTGSINDKAERNLLDAVKVHILPEVPSAVTADHNAKEKIFADPVSGDCAAADHRTADKTAADKIVAGDCVTENTASEDRVTENEMTDEAADSAETDKPAVIELGGFLCNGSGYIVGYTDAGLVVKDGLIILPENPSCRGIARGAFAGLEDVAEVYIPANISYIADGAFEGLRSLFYIEVSPDNRTFYSENGILYYNSGLVAVCPPGR